MTLEEYKEHYEFTRIKTIQKMFDDKLLNPYEFESINKVLNKSKFVTVPIGIINKIPPPPSPPEIRLINEGQIFKNKKS